MKKILVSSVLAAATLFPLIPHAEESNLPTNVVVESKIQLRKGATTSYPAITTLNSGQKVKVIDTFKNSAGEIWYRIDLGSVKGWAPAKHFKINKIVTLGTSATINSDNVNIRKGATISYPVLTKVSKGQKVNVLSTFKNTKGEVWFRVKFGEQIGWVLSKYVSTVTGTKPPTTPVQTKPVQNLPGLPLIGTTYTNPKNGTEVRKGAASSYAIVASLKAQQKVKVIGHFVSKSGEAWIRVQINSTVIGWTRYTTPKPPAEPTPTISKTLLVGTKNAILYSGAATSYKTVEKMAYLSKVSVISELTISNQTWVRLKTSSGNIGWTQKRELVESKSNIKIVYSLKGAAIRKGASVNYSAILLLKENDPLIVVNEINGWLNVETLNGVRGWMVKTQSSITSLKRFVEPVVVTQNKDTYLNWTKPSNFNFKYTTLANNKLKLSQGITDVEIPQFQIKGIQSIEKIQINQFEKSVILTFEPGYTFTIRNHSDKVSIKVIPTGLLGKKIIIDAGHGGKDTGAIGPSGLKEKDVNLGTALILKSELEKAGAIVTLTRKTDIFLELSERTDIANISDYDAFISIHADSFSATSRGSSTFYNTTVNFNGPQSAKLGEAVQKNLISSLGTYNRGVDEQNFYVNRMNELPSILVELAFISNPNEEKLLKSDSFRQKASIGIRKGLEEYFKSF